MAYPPQFLKGIPDKNALDQDGNVSAGLFKFRKPEEPRVDGFEEDSINWYDDADAVPLTLNQKKEDGTLQFKIGVAVLCTEEINHLRLRPLLKQQFEYERKPLAGNQYHGNLLLKETVSSTSLRRKIAGWIALSVDGIIPQ